MNTDVRRFEPRCSWIPAFAGLTEGALRPPLPDGEEAAGASLPRAPGAGRLYCCFRRDSKASRFSKSRQVPYLRSKALRWLARPFREEGGAPSGPPAFAGQLRREDHRHFSALRSDASSNVPG